MGHSAWSKGVAVYAEELKEEFEGNHKGEEVTKEKLLKGASDYNAGLHY